MTDSTPVVAQIVELRTASRQTPVAFPGHHRAVGIAEAWSAWEQARQAVIGAQFAEMATYVALEHRAHPEAAHPRWRIDKVGPDDVDEVDGWVTKALDTRRQLDDARAEESRCAAEVLHLLRAAVEDAWLAADYDVVWREEDARARAAEDYCARIAEETR